MKLVDKVIIVLAILAVFSAGSIVSSTIKYRQGIRYYQSVQLELSDLELRDEDKHEVLISAHMKNGSAVDVELEVFHFSLYLNGHFMGSNEVSFTGRTLDGFEETPMDFVIPIRPFYLQYIEQAREEKGFSWLLQGRAKLRLPFKDREIWIDIKERWEDTVE